MKIEIRLVGQITDENYKKLQKPLRDLMNLFDSYKFNWEENQGGK